MVSSTWSSHKKETNLITHIEHKVWELSYKLFWSELFKFMAPYRPLSLSTEPADTRAGDARLPHINFWLMFYKNKSRSLIVKEQYKDQVQQTSSKIIMLPY
jgi:hypothetical protein